MQRPWDDQSKQETGSYYRFVFRRLPGSHAHHRLVSGDRLAYIGIKMIIEALKPDSGEEGIEKDAPLNIKEMFSLAIATSIDALAVGISFAFLNYPIASAAAIIGITTFVISIIGVYIGNFFGTRYKKKAEILGGIILILIGLKILLEHLGILVL